MSAYLIMGMVIASLIIAITLKGVYDYKKNMRLMLKKAEKSFGTFDSKALEPSDFERIKKLFYRYMDDKSIDDITAFDLDIDGIFEKYNKCLSAPGKDAFYQMLRTPQYSSEYFEHLESIVKYFIDNPAERNLIRSFFVSIGSMRKVSLFDCIDVFDELKIKSLLKEIIMIIIIVFSFGLIFINSSLGIAFLVISLCLNIVFYYSSRGEIESYIISFSYIANFVKTAKKMTKVLPSVLSDEAHEISEITDGLSSFVKSSYFVSNSSNTIGTGNPLDILVDYVKMIFHIDIIRFYRMLRIIKDKSKDIERLYIVVGSIEAYINIVSIRLAVKDYCVPDKSEGIHGIKIYHPLLSDPVKNDMNTDKGILITGSNASGKSTFLKAVAINVLFSHTIHTCLADSFSCDSYMLFTSMSLRDNLNSNESYFVVEIKALKRIIDMQEKYPDRKIICFVDEVLRGTNTVERISSVTQILRYFKKKGIMCFAATHDYELTEILENEYSNYHFDEDIIDDDIIFNYSIKEGKATSRNAIKLLSLMGFEEDIIVKAQAMASEFSVSGVWK